MKNPLCKYDKHLDVIEFLKNNFVCYSDHVFVPYAEKCYFASSLFSKFNFCLNFTDDASYYFWKILKEEKDLLERAIANFTDLPFEEDRDFFEQIMFKEERPLYKAVLFAFLSHADSRETLQPPLAIDLSRVRINKEISFDYSDFVLQSLVDNFSINDDEIINNLNSFESKVVIANNPIVADFIKHDHKVDFEDSYLLVSTK